MWSPGSSWCKIEKLSGVPCTFSEILNKTSSHKPTLLPQPDKQLSSRPWRDGIPTALKGFHGEEVFEIWPVLLAVAAEWRVVFEELVFKEHTDELSAGLEQAVHLFSVSAAQCRIKGAEKSLLQNEVISAFVFEKVAKDDVVVGDDVGALLKGIHGAGRDVDKECVGKPLFEKVFALVGISAAGNQDAGGFVGESVDVFLQRRGGMADVPTGLVFIPAGLPIFRVKIFVHYFCFKNKETAST